MLSDDVFRIRLNETIEALRYWAPTVTDVASVHESDGDGFWKVSAVPFAARSCPFEFVLRTDQHHDLTIAREVFEDQPTDSLDLFVPLATAISEGRVVQRFWATVATGTLCAVETIVSLGDGSQWRGNRVVSRVAVPGSDGTTFVDRSFLPYHRR